MLVKISFVGVFCLLVLPSFLHGEELKADDHDEEDYNDDDDDYEVDEEDYNDDGEEAIDGNLGLHELSYYDAEEAWNSWDMPSIYWWLLLCPDVHHNPEINPDAFPVYNSSTWRYLRQTYRETVGAAASSLPPPEEDGISDDDLSTGFQVPFQARISERRGRGIFATEFIPSGTLVWTSKYTAQFTTAEQYRTYLRKLSPALACDGILWFYTRWVIPEGATTSSSSSSLACVDLDPGSLNNSEDDYEESNLELLANPERVFHSPGCNVAFYATRDIAAEEELIVKYDFSARAEEWWDAIDDGSSNNDDQADTHPGSDSSRVDDEHEL